MALFNYSGLCNSLFAAVVVVAVPRVVDRARNFAIPDHHHQQQQHEEKYKKSLHPYTQIILMVARGCWEWNSPTVARPHSTEWMDAESRGWWSTVYGYGTRPVQ